MTRLQVTTPDELPEETGAEAALRPSRLDEFVGPGAGQGLAPDRHRRGQGAGRDAGPHPLLRPARTGQDHAGDADGAGDGRPDPHHLGPGAGEAGRPGRPADQPRARATCSSSTRSTGSGRCWRSSSIRPWRTSGWTSGSPTGPTPRPSRWRSSAFTLIGATTRFGLLTPPMRARFGMVERLNFYPPDELGPSSTRSAGILGVPIDSRRRARDRPPEPGHAAGRQPAAPPGAGLRPGPGRREDHRARWRGRRWPGSTWTSSASTTWTPGSSRTIIEKFGGGPVGLNTIAVAVGEDAGTLEEVYEPYLIQQGFLERTPRGRLRHRARLPPLRLHPARRPGVDLRPPAPTPGDGDRSLPPDP